MATQFKVAVMARKESRKIRRHLRKPSEAERLALQILPQGTAHLRAYEAIDVANHTDADQRKMVRSGERRTLRRTPKVIELYRRGQIDKRELLACEWYANAHAARYDTTGITANLGGTGGRSSTNFDHLPKTREQQEAFDSFEYAREGINPVGRMVLERVVLHGRPMGRLAITFRTAVRQLLAMIEGRVKL